MKRIFTLLLVVAMMVSIVACGGDNTNTTASTVTTADSNTTTATTGATTTVSTTPVVPSINEGELKTGVYTATSSYATEGMNMTWNFVLTFKADGTFTLTDNVNTDKGTGTYALTENCYTLTYADGRTATFVVQKDGTLKLTTDFPYGMATIQLALVGDIIFTFKEGLPSDSTTTTTTVKPELPTTTYTIAAGTYAAEYEKVSGMAGTVLYKYTAVVGADGTFSYSVKFNAMGSEMTGDSATGTYTVAGNKFTFTDSNGNVTEGTLTADNTLVISLKASSMATEAYEVTFAPAVYTIAAGTYAAEYEKVSGMAGTVLYKYTAVVGADGTFSYSVKFNAMGSEMTGDSATGTYTVAGNKFTFTDSNGNVTEGTLTADNTLVISLKASSMATEAYEVTFTVAE